MIILGIDPSLSHTGLAILDYNVDIQQGKVLATQVCITTPKEKIEDRLDFIYNALQKLANEYPINMIAFEELPCMKNNSTIKKMAYVLGIILLFSKQSQIKIHGYYPLTIRSTITGNIKSSKEEVAKEVLSILKTTKEGLYFSNKKQYYHDVTDAIAVAFTHLKLRS